MKRPVIRLAAGSAIILISTGLAASTAGAGAVPVEPSPPLVIAHRGASGDLPEHTLEAYRLAVELGADYVEPDVVMTSDGVAIARHDNVLNLTTDVADRPEFADRRTTKSVDGVEVDGWFSEDLTLAEIKSLRAIERIPDVRPANAEFDGLYEVPTLDEVLSLVAELEVETGRVIGVYPETKHPTHFADLGLDIGAAVLGDLTDAGYGAADDAVFIQSFEVSNLRDLDEMTDLPLVQLISGGGAPFDQVAAGNPLNYADMATAAGLSEIATYADGVGPSKTVVIPLDASGELHIENATSFVDDAHANDLIVHPYTFRRENTFLPANYRIGDDPIAPGDLVGEIGVYLRAGIDGYFTDNSGVGVEAKIANSNVGPVFGVDLLGSNEVPPASDGDPDGSGSAKVTVWEARGEVCLDVTVAGIAEVTMGHIHQGVSGANGDVVVDFALSQDDIVRTDADDVEGGAFRCVAVEQSIRDAIVADPAGHYVNVHTVEFPGGAVRGQLSSTPDPEIPEAPVAVALTISAAAIGAGVILLGRRRQRLVTPA